MIHKIKNFLGKFGFFQDSVSMRQRIYALLERPSKSAVDLSLEEHRIIKNILDLHDVSVEDIMTPRADIVALPLKSKLKELTALIAKHPFTRYPVYEENLDDIKGLIHVKDLYQFMDKKTFDIKSILQKILFVPHSSELPDLLTQMRLAKTPMAIVVDEYGGVDGLVTPRDMMQEILGSIPTLEVEENQPQLKYISEGLYEADARVPIEDFEQVFGKILTPDDEEEEIDTVGGLVISLAGRVPGRKEVITHSSGIEFEVLEATPRSVLKVLIRCPFPTQALSKEGS